MAILPFLDIFSKVIDQVIPDADKKMELKLELAKLADAENERAHKEALGQIETNKVEAGHRSIFVAGWRPAIGWGSGAALVYNTLVAPMFGLGVADLGFLQTVLLAMLGIGGMRSYDKAKGTANDAPFVVSNASAAVSVQEQPVKTRKKVLPFDIPGIKGI